VVCVEDDPDTVDLLRFSAAGEPDIEIVATTGEAKAVLSLLREHRPDVVILDHRLDDPASLIPERRARGVAATQTGLELVESARSTLPEATIVIFTGRHGLGVAARNAGADAYVEKPDFAAVWPAVREARPRRDRSNATASRGPLAARCDADAPGMLRPPLRSK
jgi:CheY-like chemotaxis protein